MTIAGHTFLDTPTGRQCSCGRYWKDISGAREDDIGQSHIAHTGALNSAELLQIQEEVARVWATVAETCA